MQVFRLRQISDLIDYQVMYGPIEEDGYNYFKKDRMPKGVITVYTTRESAERALKQVNPDPEYARPTDRIYGVVEYAMEEVPE